MLNFNSYLLAPHNDDEALFASYTIMRFKPKVIVVTRSIKQETRHIRYHTRNNETRLAMETLGVEFELFDIPETELTVDNLSERLQTLTANIIFAPALQGGHPHHDIVCIASDNVFGGKVIHYATYTKDNLTPVGNIEIIPTQEEIELKNKALDCYASQFPWNQSHFDAVRNKSEYWIA